MGQTLSYTGTRVSVCASQVSYFAWGILLSFCLVRPSMRPSVHLSVCPTMHLPSQGTQGHRYMGRFMGKCPSVHTSVCLSVCSSVHPYALCHGPVSYSDWEILLFGWSVHTSVCPSVRLSVSPSICAFGITGYSASQVHG